MLLSELNEGIYVATLGKRANPYVRAPPGRKPESGEAKGRGCCPCPDVGPHTFRGRRLPGWRLPWPRNQIRGGPPCSLLLQRKRGDREKSGESTESGAPRGGGPGGGRRPSLSPPRASPLSSPPSSPDYLLPRRASGDGHRMFFRSRPPPPPPLSLSLRSLPPLPPRPAPAPCLTPPLPRSAALRHPRGSHPSRPPPRTRSALDGCPGKGGRARVLGIYWPARGRRSGKGSQGMKPAFRSPSPVHRRRVGWGVGLPHYSELGARGGRPGGRG